MPCRIIANPQRMAQLNGRNTSFICCAQIDCPEPEGQRKTCAVHDRSGGNRGLVPAGTALVGVATVNGIVFHAAALGTYKPIWKAKSEQFRSASILAVVTAAKFLECDLSCACHNVVPLFVLATLSHISCPIKRTFSRRCGLLS